MSKKIYTLNSSFLVSLYPCMPGLSWFEEKFPTGVILTNNQQEMFELCEHTIDNAEDNRDNSASFLEWLCINLRVKLQLPQDKYFYFGSYPYGTSYGRPGAGTQDELSSYEPEHCALIICMFVDKFGKVNASNRLSSSK